MGCLLTGFSPIVRLTLSGPDKCDRRVLAPRRSVIAGWPLVSVVEGKKSRSSARILGTFQNGLAPTSGKEEGLFRPLTVTGHPSRMATDRRNIRETKVISQTVFSFAIAQSWAVRLSTSSTMPRPHAGQSAEMSVDWPQHKHAGCSRSHAFSR